MSQVRVKLVGKLVPRSPPASLGWVAALQHEALNHPVEGDSIVVPAAGEIEEIGASERGLRGIQGGLDVSSGGVKGDANVGHARSEARPPARGNARGKNYSSW